MPASAESSSLPWRIQLWLGMALSVVFGVIFLFPAGPWWAVDFQGILEPYQHYLRHSLSSGTVPLWNPYASLGRPFLADPQAVALWPGTLAYLVLGARWGAYVLTVAHAWLAVRGTAYVAGRFGAHRWAGWLAGLGFVLNAKLLGHLHAGHIQYLLSCYTLPAVIAVFLKLQDSASLRQIAFFALIICWQLLMGAPQVFWCTAVLVALLGLAFWLGQPSTSGFRGLIRTGTATLLGYGWALLLSAALLLPMLELVTQSNRGTPLAALSAVGPLQWTDWPSLFTVFSEPGRLKDYEVMLYPGLFAAVLGMAGLLQLRDPRSRILLIAAGAVVLLAIAPGTPLHPWLLDWLPGYGSFRIHARWAFALGWLLSIGAALFVSGAGTALTRRVALFGIAFLGLGTLMSLYPSPLWDPLQAANIWNPLPVALLLLVATAGGALSHGGSAARRIGRLALIVAVIAELGTVLVFYKGGYPRSLSRPWNDEIAKLTAHYGRTGSVAPVRAYFPRRIAWENAGMQLGYSSLFGYESLALIRPRSIIHWTMGIEPPSDTDFPAFYLLDQRLPWPVDHFGLQLGYDPALNKIVDRPEPDQARAWLANSVEMVADWREAGRRIAAGEDGRRPAFLEQAVPLHNRPADPSPGTVSFLQYGTNQVSLLVTTSQPALLVLAEPWYPGWEVQIDHGHPTAALPANGWMRAAVVPAGTSTVDFRFHSRWLPLGLALSGGTLLVTLWIILRRNRTRFN